MSPKWMFWPKKEQEITFHEPITLLAVSNQSSQLNAGCQIDENRVLVSYGEHFLYPRFRVLTINPDNSLTAGPELEIETTRTYNRGASLAMIGENYVIFCGRDGTGSPNSHVSTVLLKIEGTSVTAVDIKKELKTWGWGDAAACTIDDTRALIRFYDSSGATYCCITRSGEEISYGTFVQVLLPEADELNSTSHEIRLLNSTTAVGIRNRATSGGGGYPIYFDVVEIDGTNLTISSYEQSAINYTSVGGLSKVSDTKAAIVFRMESPVRSQIRTFNVIGSSATVVDDFDFPAGHGGYITHLNGNKYLVGNTSGVSSSFEFHTATVNGGISVGERYTPAIALARNSMQIKQIELTGNRALMLYTDVSTYYDSAVMISSK